jgi:catechol 2,3-dioxygenase-like lactoylglutathione lyase family enzyme
MLDHVTIGVSDVGRSKAFYDRILKPIGIERYAEGDVFQGYGANGKAFFWIGLKPHPVTGMHIAFAVQSRALVDIFHSEALAAGARDNGAPGLRPHYHPHYYGAFIFDPDGHNVEAVCHISM